MVLFGHQNPVRPDQLLRVSTMVRRNYWQTVAIASSTEFGTLPDLDLGKFRSDAKNRCALAKARAASVARETRQNARPWQCLALRQASPTPAATAFAGDENSAQDSPFEMRKRASWLPAFFRITARLNHFHCASRRSLCTSGNSFRGFRCD